MSARKGLSLLWCLTTQGSLVQRQFLSPVIYRLPRRTSRGTPPTIYPVNTQPLAFCLFCTRKTFASISLSKIPVKQHISLYWEHLRCKVFIKMTSFCLCLLFVSLSTPFPRLSFCSSPVNVLKKFRGTLLSEMCKLFFLSISLGVRYLLPVRYLSLKCHVRCLLFFLFNCVQQNAKQS